MPKPREVAIDVIVAEDDTISPNEKCMYCEGRFAGPDCVVRVRDFRAMVDYAIHRRCMIQILDAGPVDDDEFETYTQRLAARYAAQ